MFMDLTAPPIIVGAFVVFFLLIFLFLYALPAWMLRSDLKKAVASLASLQKHGDVVEKHLAESSLQHNPHLLHAWKEYAHTLHPQHDRVDGELRLKALRATAPAEMFFSPVTVVDTPIRAEFFKHLPGILTGIGIIGTFAGLILGLQSFNVDTDAQALQQNLGHLLKSVWEAFLASGFAIGMAILVTLLEKSLLNSCYGLLEGLVQLIDGFYEAGAGEEYLASLVKSAEESATQTRQLKDSLVNDLKSLLENFAFSLGQVFQESLSTHSREMVNVQTTALPEAIAKGLSGPMDEITKATRTLGGDQSQAVSDLMSAVLGKLETTFGGQMGNLNDLIEQNATVMRELQDGFKGLLGNLKQTSEESSAKLSQHLRQLMTDIESRQDQMNGAILNLVDQMRISAESERGMGEKWLQSTLTELTTTVDRLMADLTRQRQTLGEAGQLGLSELQQGLARLIDEVRSASRSAGSAYEAELKRLLESAGERQRELGQEIRSLVEEMRDQQSTQQHETAERLQSALASINAMVEQTEKSGAQREELRAKSDAERTARLDESVDQTLARFTEQASTLAEKVKEGVIAMAATVANLERVTIKGAGSLSDAADQLLNAAVEIEQAGKQTATTIDHAAILQSEITSTAKHLETASRPLQDMIRGYQQQQEHISKSMDTLRGMVADAESRAGINKEMIADMKGMVETVRTLQTEAKQYLEQVNSVLQTGFDSFADAVTKNMSRARAEFDRGLAEAVSMISSQIQELEAALDALVRSAASKGR